MLIELILRRFGVGYTEFSLSFPLSLSRSRPPVALPLCLSTALEKESPMGTSVRERIRESINDAWKAESTLFSSPLSRLHYFSIRTSFQKTITWSNLNPNHISTTTSTAKQKKKGWVRRGGKGPRHHHVRYQISDLYQRLPPQRKNRSLEGNRPDLVWVIYRIMSQISSVHHTKDMADHPILHVPEQSTPDTISLTLKKTDPGRWDRKRESDKAHLERKNRKTSPCH